MAYTDKYREEHNELLAGVTEINNLINQGVEAKASQIFILLGKLSMKIKIHLKKEDDFLYPSLISCGKDDVAQEADKFKSEMSGILNVYMGFDQKYSTSKAIVEAAANFKNDFAGIVSALGARIEKENSVLYKLADQNL